MKKIILCLLLFGFFSSGHSQILLKETKIENSPKSMKLHPVSDNLLIKIPEMSVGEFAKDPLAFMKSNFDVQRFIVENERRDFDTFFVNFKSKKGNLVAEFDRSGDLMTSAQRFKNVKLPDNERLQLLEKYRDAAIVGNKYVAISEGWDLKKEYYIVKIKDGNKTRRVKINKDRNVLTFEEH